jgi:hypothetical protein
MSETTNNGSFANRAVAALYKCLKSPSSMLRRVPLSFMVRRRAKTMSSRLVASDSMSQQGYSPSAEQRTPHGLVVHGRYSRHASREGSDYTVDNTNTISEVRGSGRTNREVSLHAVVDQSVKRNRSVTFLFTARGWIDSTG